MKLRELAYSMGRIATMLSCASLLGCQGMYLHNPDRAAVAATAKTSIDAVDVASIRKTQQENLAKLLAAEIKAIDDRSRLIATLAVIDLAASDQTIAEQYESAVGKMQSVLHTSSMLALKGRGDCLLTRQSAVRQDRSFRGVLSGYGVQKIPACAADMPPQLPVPDGLTLDQITDLSTTYASYLGNCRTLQNQCAGVEVIDELGKARDDLARAQSAESTLKGQIEKATKEYQALVKANKDRTTAAEETANTIREKAKKVTDLVDKLAEVSPSLANRIKGGAIVELLGAAASGKSDATDPDLAPALEIARAVPALAESVEIARAKKATVPVSHLLLALINLTIQAERDDRLQALDAKDIAVIEQRVEAIDAQVRLWKRYNDQLCNFVVLRATTGRYPGGSCDTITFPNGMPELPVIGKEPANAQGSKRLACHVKVVQDTKTTVQLDIDDCVLGASWRDLFDGNLSARERRALNEAAAAYLHARLIAYSGTVAEFRRIDIDHQRTVVRNEAAIEQWKNLVSVPANELAAYYAGGIKPAELADLIVKAVGFTAIAIGVAQ